MAFYSRKGIEIVDFGYWNGPPGLIHVKEIWTSREALRRHFAARRIDASQA
jgi:quinol monooxygenase YgiN